MTTKREGINLSAKPSGTGCVECLATDGWWLHLRRCAECGRIGCCDNSPSQHGSKHAAATNHPIATSFKPGESWSGIIKQARKSKDLSCFLLMLTPHPNLPQVCGGRCRTIGNQSLTRLHIIRKLKVKEKNIARLLPGDKIEISFFNEPGHVEYATVCRTLTGQQEGLVPEIEDYVACWLEVSTTTVHAKSAIQSAWKPISSIRRTGTES